MKYFWNILIFSVILQLSNGKNIEEGLRDILEQTKKNPTRENVLKLGGAIRGNYRYQELLTQDALAVTIEVSEALCKIPGHAQYFADEIERLIADPANKGSSIRQRSWYIEETLPHLPSPETIWVLGNYLHDERYTPMKGLDNSGATPESSYLATNALRWIGLRESEDAIRTEKGSRYSDVYDVKKLRAWWEEIKSGKRTFSFKGQKVEYRFKPGGTWDTIAMTNPPDDGPKPPKPKPVPHRPVKLPPPPPETTSDSDPRRGMFVVALLFVLGIVGFLVLRRKNDSIV